MGREPKIIPFGKYELLEKIAVGGMAEIFKTRTKGVGGFEKYLAIKRILPHLSENKDFIDMLINEAKIAVMLSHANIVQIYDLGKIEDSYFIAMEYIEGKDLRALMSRCDQIGMPLFIQHAVFVTIEVCKGLEYAHAKTEMTSTGPREMNIVHRDVSPQNVMISYEGEVKITDFGIAKATVNIRETEAGVVKGKYEYMSPEQASGLAVDRRTDIFSTGIVLYEMLTEKKPFRGESDLSILERVREAKVEPPSKYNKSIPKKLENIVLKALAKEPGDRYQTATELKDELTRFFYSSTFNFTTSNLAAFMKSVFSEEIRVDVLSDADKTSGKLRLDISDGEGQSISRVFGKSFSVEIASKLGEHTPAVAQAADPQESVLEERSASRTLGTGALENIEEEINRVLIPGSGRVVEKKTAPVLITPSTGEPISAERTIEVERQSRSTARTRPIGPEMESDTAEVRREVSVEMPTAEPSRTRPHAASSDSGDTAVSPSESTFTTDRSSFRTGSSRSSSPLRAEAPHEAPAGAAPGRRGAQPAEPSSEESLAEPATTRAARERALHGTKGRPLAAASGQGRAAANPSRAAAAQSRGRPAERSKRASAPVDEEDDKPGMGMILLLAAGGSVLFLFGVLFSTCAGK